MHTRSVCPGDASLSIALTRQITHAEAHSSNTRSGQRSTLPPMRVTRAAARATLAKEKEKEETFWVLNLPPELVEQIFGHLIEDDARTLPKIRLVCRAFSNHYLIHFGTVFFNHVIAILHPLSLTILLEIASHPHLSRFVSQVTISGERLGGVIDMLGQNKAAWRIRAWIY